MAHVSSGLSAALAGSNVPTEEPIENTFNPSKAMENNEDGNKGPRLPCE